MKIIETTCAECGGRLPYTEGYRRRTHNGLCADRARQRRVEAKIKTWNDRRAKRKGVKHEDHKN